MAVNYAHKVYSGTTGVLEYLITFEYIDAADLKVLIDGVEIAHGTGANQWYLSNGGLSIKFTSPNEPQTGETLVIRRTTDITVPAVDFALGAGTTADNLNTALKQLRLSIDDLQYPAYISTVKTITQLFSQEINEPHNLGAAPSRWIIHLRCISADLGYSINDVVDIHASETHVPVVWTTTHLQVPDSGIYASFKLPHKTTGVQTTVTGTSWALFLLAWR